MKKPESGLFFSNSTTSSVRINTCSAPAGRMAAASLRGASDPTSPLGGSPPQSARRIQELQEQMRANSRRDGHLWLMVIFVVLVQSAGFAGILAPSLAWKSMNLHLDLRNLPQQFWGMLTLVTLFSIYLTMQRREVAATRTALMQELVVGEKMQSFSLLDPVTQLLKSCAVDNLAAREVARANRTGSALTLAIISLDNFSALQKRFGVEEAEKALFYSARLFETTFRGSDAIFRNGLHEFLVIMPDTTEQQAETAISRLKANVERWNAESDGGVELSFSGGVAAYISGANVSDIIERARRCMFLNSQKINLVF
ncbi:MAG: GGDEF domain-containing protein [Acidobacteria bacterium]|nr:GGDEF domain-containing protein [Acidobacteriota bacterium]